ncbi:MAG: cyclopropane-fatty-acyl-phospholipid synthase family protein [Sphingomonadaceae bacterium]|nr:cyclopropane-fatty-acyl-phospholipid synthase family protein [Sphingomonadaceae bacterium]
MLRELARRMIQVGRLTVRIGDEPSFTVGTVPIGSPELDVTIRLRNRWIANLLALDPEYQLGPTYMDGDLTIERGSIGSFMELIGRNLGFHPGAGALGKARDLLGRLVARTNSAALARRNVAHHYDLSEGFFRLLLDDDLQYSCAYFAEPGMTLEQAQATKKAHIAAKLDLAARQRVLDIGCGWGGLALSLAKAADVNVTGITLSAEQLRIASARAAAEGLADRVHFELVDYRTVRGRFDRIVSVGMFEHVGREYLGDYFGAIDRLLANDGVALIHFIARKDAGAGSDRWTRRYIFPGGYIPSVSQALAALEPTGLWPTDAEMLRLHYASTLRCWRQRASAHRAVIEELYGARFYRMWEYYLASCEMSFRFNGLMVLQLQIARAVDTLPITRTYMAETEQRLRADMQAGLPAALAYEAALEKARRC